MSCTTGGQYNPATSIFAGMSRPQLQAALAAAQQAYLDLQSGKKAVSLSYTQGDGTKTVGYTPATTQGLVMLIKQLQAQLGIVRRARRPIQFGFR